MSNAFKKAGNRLLARILAHNEKAGNYRKTVWVIGDGRSGTTWVADLLNPRNQFRKMFEPFHPELVKGMEVITPHEYIRPNQVAHPLRAVAADVFSGKFRYPRVDSRNRRFVYTGIVVKDIYANLFAGWARRQFPELAIVLVIRNPFSVALSKQGKPDWLWAKDPRSFLRQPNLVEDFLAPHTDLIYRTAERNSFILNQILIWAIVHLIPLSQLRVEDATRVYYEELYSSPLDEVQKLKASLNISCEMLADPTEKQIGKPTRSAGTTSHIVTGTSPVDSWKNQLDSSEIDAGMRILDAFPSLQEHILV